MRRTKPAAWLLAFFATATLSGQSATQAPPPPQPQAQAQTPVFTKTVSYKAMDLLVRDGKNRFVPGLTKDDFELYEDGVLQKIDVFYPVIGGRAVNPPAMATAPAARPVGGLILPKRTAQADISGRVFVILIDDMSIAAVDTPKTKQVLKYIRDTLIQDNDLVGIVSSGYSSIAVDLTHDYEHVRMNEAIKRTAGAGMTPDDIVRASNTSKGPAGLRYQAYMAMRTARDILDRAAQMTDRRKAFIYVSAGYDFDPFKGARLKHENDVYGVGTGKLDAPSDPNKVAVADPNDPNSRQGVLRDINGTSNRNSVFAEQDLIAELAELIRVANRANMTIYTVDPRGLMAGPDIGSTAVLTTNDWIDYKTTTLNSLHALADNTGGFCVCSTNEYEEALKRIDNETSDYYMVGYNSTNQDRLKLKRKIEIKSKKTGLTLFYRNEYTLPRPGKG
jgi:VWFA-related protein